MYFFSSYRLTRMQSWLKKVSRVFVTTAIACTMTERLTLSPSIVLKSVLLEKFHCQCLTRYLRVLMIYKFPAEVRDDIRALKEKTCAR